MFFLTGPTTYANKYLMRNALLVLLLTIPFVSFAQSSYSVKGRVVTAKGYSPIGNVVALNPRDSSFIKGAAFFDGNFSLRDIKPGNVLIKLSSLEFKDTILALSYRNDTLIDLGQVIVRAPESVLGEVVVRSKRPLYTQKNDGTLEISVQNTTLAATNSVNEILTRSPEIVPDGDGGLSVLGRGRAILYLNGRRITEDQLSLILPGNVKKVEIIRNPSSKYDAEGAAVISITTIKQADDGYQVSLKQNVSYSDFSRGALSYSNANINYKRGRISANGNYALQLGKEREVLHTTRNRDAEHVFLTTDLTSSWNRDFKNYSYYGAGLQFDINDRNYISLEYSGSSENLGGNTLSSNQIVDDSGPSFYKSNISMDEKNVNNSLSLNYKSTLDSLGSSLFIGGQYSNYDIGTNNPILEESRKDNAASSRMLKQLQDLGINVYAAQIDFSKVFRNNDVLEMGAKASRVNNDFDLDFLVAEDGVEYKPDPERSINFTYDEAISAGYLSYKSKLSRNIDYSLGVRGEYTDYNLELSQVRDQVIKNTYFNLLPNASANFKLANNYNINFSYTARINRPPYQRLNPVLIYQDPYTSVQGNPNLIPEKVHAFELGSKIGQTSLKLGYNYTKDPLGQTALRGSDLRSYILKRINYDARYEFFASATRTFNVKFWTSTNTVTLKYTNITDNAFEFERIEPRPNLYYYTNNRFDLGHSYNAEVMFWYMGNNREGLYDRNDMYNLTASIGKSFFNNALKVNLLANDILHSVVQSGDYFVGQTAVYYNRVSSTNYFRLSLMYNFGKLKKVDYKNKAIGKPESDRI